MRQQFSASLSFVLHQGFPVQGEGSRNDVIFRVPSILKAKPFCDLRGGLYWCLEQLVAHTLMGIFMVTSLTPGDEEPFP